MKQQSKSNNNAKPNSNKGRCNSNGRKPNYRRSNNVKGKDITKPDERMEAEGNINDSSYYYGDANVLDQVMNFSFNQFGGVPFSVELDDNTTTSATVHNTMVAVYYLNPSVPQSHVSSTGVNTSGINTAALRNFLALSGSNAKTTTYAPQDVIILTLAVAELIKIATFCARAFGVAYLFNYRNRTYPETLLTAMGIDSANFANDLARLRVKYNKLLTLAAKIPFPADIPLFKKASELYASIYLDDPSSALAQTYMFVPNTTWVYDEAYDSNGAGLRTTQLVTPGTPVFMDSILNTFESMISALLNSTGLNAIYSDIMRLAQSGKVGSFITFNSIPENFVITPVYNEEIKIWLHNAYIMGAPLSTAAQYEPNPSVILTNRNDVCCDAGSNSVLYHPEFKLVYPGLEEGIIDFDHDNVTVEDKVRATRLSQKPMNILTNGSDYYADFNALADEYLVRVHFYTGESAAPTLTLDSSFITTTTIANTVHLCDVVSKFDWAPILYKVNGSDLDTIGDLDYYTTIHANNLQRIYDYEIIHLLQIG